MIDCAKKGMVEIFKETMNEYYKEHKSYIDINIADEQGNTSLHGACLEGNKKFVELLLQLEARVNLQNLKGETPLHLSVDGFLFNIGDS